MKAKLCLLGLAVVIGLWVTGCGDGKDAAGVTEPQTETIDEREEQGGKTDEEAVPDGSAEDGNSDSTQPADGRDADNGSAQEGNGNGDSARSADGRDADNGNAQDGNKSGSSVQACREKGGIADSGKASEELEGTVMEIGDNSVMVSKVLSEKLDDGSEVSIAYMDGSGELIEVRLSENTSFSIREIRNGGVNGEADVTAKAAAKADIELNGTLQMTGYWDGAVFCAERVDIIRVV